MTLSTIPRASSVGATSGYIEENIIININRASSNFRHTLTCSFHNTGITIAEKTSDTTINWTIPRSFYEQIPNQKSSWGTIYCYTYNGDTKIGESRCTFTVNTNETRCKPTLSVTIEDTNNKTIIATGDKNKLVRYCSDVKVTVSCSSKNSASISNKNVNNINIANDNVIIENVTTNKFTVTVTDSRGYSTSQTITKDMVNYIKPTANVQFNRKSPTSSEYLLKFDGNFFNGSFGSVSNSLILKWRYKEASSNTYSDWSRLQQVEDGNKYSNGTTAISLGTNFNYQKGYTFQFNYSDTLSNEIITIETSRGEPILWWNKGIVGVNGDFKVTGKFSVGALDNLDFEFWGFLSTISGTENSIKVNKIEKSCTFSFAVNFDSAQEGDFVLATFNEQYAPKNKFFSTCVIVSNNVTTSCQCSIGTDGSIDINNYGQPSSTFRGQIKWYY